MKYALLLALIAGTAFAEDQTWTYSVWGRGSSSSTTRWHQYAYPDRAWRDAISAATTPEERKAALYTGSAWGREPHPTLIARLRDYRRFEKAADTSKLDPVLSLLPAGAVLISADVTIGEDGAVRGIVNYRLGSEHRQERF